MSKRRSHSSKKKRNARNSMFDAPNVKQEIVKNTCYADINFDSPADLDEYGYLMKFQPDAFKQDPLDVAPEHEKPPKKKCSKCKAKSSLKPKSKSPPLDEGGAACLVPSATSAAPENKTHRKPTAHRKSSPSAAVGSTFGQRLFKSRRPRFKYKKRPVDANKEKPPSQPCPKFNLREIAACEQSKNEESILVLDSATKSHERLPSRVGPPNPSQEVHGASYYLPRNWLDKLRCRWAEKRRERLQNMTDAATPIQQIDSQQSDPVDTILEGFGRITLADVEQATGGDESSSQIGATNAELVEFTAEQHACLSTATEGPLNQVLIFKFGLNITRRDIHTLFASNWLNDEVINFYMNLLIERAERKHSTHGLPRVYAMNTFFMQRLLQSGYGGVRRWTRKVNLFEKDVIPVPIHMNGMHWCMAIIDLRDSTIKYYDSLGGSNPRVLDVLQEYLQAESWDKRKQLFDVTDIQLESVRNIPHQLNGSDCGVFSCMFAEYICGNRPITFSQANMPYFRQRMILEILQGELLQ